MNAAPAEPACFIRLERRADMNSDDLHGAVTRLRACAIWSVLVSIVIALLLYASLDVRLDPNGIHIFAWLLAAVLLVSRIWWGRPGHHRIADALGTCSVAALGGMACGVVAMLTLPLHLPLADRTFLQLDHAIGADTIDMVSGLARLGQPIFDLTWPAYNFTLQAFFVSLLLLSFSGDRLEAWRASACFVTTLLSVCLIAAFLPAKGAGVWGNREFFALLPDSAMRGFWAHFDEFYSGRAPVLRMRGIDGVISFPSFHTIVGLIVVAMWRKNWFTLLLATVWFWLMLPGTLIYGGHYVVDLIGGFLVWLFWFGLTQPFGRSLRFSFWPPATGIGEAPVFVNDRA